DAVDYAGVIELIAINHILIIGLSEIICQQRGEEGLVGGETRRVKDCRFAAYELRDPLLELDVDRFSPAKKTHRRHTVAPLVEPAMRGRLDSRVIRKAKIVVGSQHNDLAAANHHVAILLAFERNFVFESLCFFEGLKLAI